MRQAINVLIMAYQLNPIQYAVFKRSDGPIYQGIAGGVEDSESPYEAALREVYEETGLKVKDLIELDAVFSMPASIFSCYKQWDTHVVKEICFAGQINEDIHLSHEHTAYE